MKQGSCSPVFTTAVLRKILWYGKVFRPTRQNAKPPRTVLTS